MTIACLILSACLPHFTYLHAIHVTKAYRERMATKNEAQNSKHSKAHSNSDDDDFSHIFPPQLQSKNEKKEKRIQKNYANMGKNAEMN